MESSFLITEKGEDGLSDIFVIDPNIREVAVKTKKRGILTFYDANYQLLCYRYRGSYSNYGMGVETPAIVVWSTHIDMFPFSPDEYPIHIGFMYAGEERVRGIEFCNIRIAREKAIEKERRYRLERDVMRDLKREREVTPNAMRPPFPREVVDAVYTRDGGRCVYCGSTQNIHLDHIVPFSKGGATIVQNLQLLCQKCNLEKSNKIG